MNPVSWFRAVLIHDDSPPRLVWYARSFLGEGTTKGTMGTTPVCPGQAARFSRHSKRRVSIGIVQLAKNDSHPFRVQAAQVHFIASHLQLRIRDTSGGTRGGTICAQ
jgi:hypothetical protein